MMTYYIDQLQAAIRGNAEVLQALDVQPIMTQIRNVEPPHGAFRLGLPGGLVGLGSLCLEGVFPPPVPVGRRRGLARG